MENFVDMIMYENALKLSETAYANDPLDADNLTRWGGILLELSNFTSDPNQKNLVEDAISKFEEALGIDPDKHDTLWCLGNAYISNGLMIQSRDEADIYFEKAAQSFEQALELEPKIVFT